MSNNTDLWSRAFVTDPKHVKAITGKQYKGNSPKPYWIVQRLTEELGPCGVGWGFDIANERFERLTETDVLHVAVLTFWHLHEGNRAQFQQIGQTKAVYKTNAGSLMVDEDAPKKSVTDALVKCASYLGFAGDIFMGLWDDSKYVAHAAEEWDRRTDPEAAAKADRRNELDELALYMIECHQSNNDLEAIRLWYAQDTFTGDDPNEERKYVWECLKAHSKLRSTIKSNKPEQVAA